MNITLSADARLIEKVRKAAQARGTTLNELIRDYMRQIAQEKTPETLADEFVAFMRENSARPRQGFRFDRNEIHERSGRP
ncbi:MAG: DUF6364 family protein [Tepidisphaeraceae bacterium]